MHKKKLTNGVFANARQFSLWPFGMHTLLLSKLQQEGVTVIITSILFVRFSSYYHGAL